MKKILYTILMVSALFFAACSSPTSSSGSDSGSDSSNQKNPDGTTVTYEKLQLKTGSTINSILVSLNTSNDAEAFLPSKTPPEKSEDVKYLDLLEEDVPIWYNSSNKTIYFYADDVTTEEATKKLKLNNDSSKMFYNCKTLACIDVSNFDTANVKNISSMFSYCESLTSLDVTSFNTSNVTNLAFMFSGCKKLLAIDVSNFDTKNCTDMKYMFFNCGALTSLDLSNFNTSKVTNMDSMFSGCRKITELDISNFNTAMVTDMYEMFNHCEELTVIDVSNFDTSNVTDMTRMFADASKVTILDFSNFDTSNVSKMTQMFYFCYDLTTIYASDKFDTTLAATDERYGIFGINTKLVGGKGTEFSNEHEGLDYAHIDGGSDNPGYFTAKSE